MLKNIQRQGCDVAPVGHHDGKNNDIQWRISFPGVDIDMLVYIYRSVQFNRNKRIFYWFNEFFIK
jgi:hypothetical protein